MIDRRKTRQIHVGPVPVGGDAPITVQSMTTTKTADVDGTLAQVYALAGAGADIVRITCNEVEAAQGLAEIVPRSPVPIIADIHYQYRLALAALEAGVQGLRLNPGNIRKEDQIKAVGGVENLTEETMPEAHIRGDINTPYRCIGGAVFTMQRAGFARVGFISEPPGGPGTVVRQ